MVFLCTVSSMDMAKIVIARFDLQYLFFQIGISPMDIIILI